MTQLTTTPIWQALREHYNKISLLHMRDLFQADPQRFNKFSLSAAGIFLDYSKNRITSETLQSLNALTAYINLPDKITQLFNGSLVNSSENRPALHTALRQQSDDPIIIDGKNIIAEIRDSQKKLAQITTSIQKKQWLGFNNQVITDIVNIGVGGSDLGAAMTIQALKPYAVTDLRFHFISNIDGSHITEILNHINPATTLFIISSKNFTTHETLFNARTVKNWFTNHCQNNAIDKHFLAITCKPERAIAFGIPKENILPIWDWVGGRFSIWSAIGLPLRLMIGNENFAQFLAGAAAMDRHFYTAPFTENMPVILALLSIWYGNFFQTQNQAIIPYDHQLQLLPTYLQQAHMESHGKQTSIDGAHVDYSTGSAIWGGIGTNGQHTFHQLFYQGTYLIPIDFILVREPQHELNENHNLLFANCLSQSRGLMLGKTHAEVVTELMAHGLSQQAAEKIAPHKVIPGNCPSNTILIPKLTPYFLGALLSLYEHKIFVQGAIWNINCFDQWGVELGKHLIKDIEKDLENGRASETQDASTRGLIDYYLQHQSILTS